MKRIITSFLLLFLLLISSTWGKNKVFHATDFGIKPNTRENVSPLVQKALQTIRQEMKEGDKATLKFLPGRYDFHEEGATLRQYYISNHDQDNPKKVGVAIEEFSNFTLDGQGAQFVFFGRMLPVSLIGSTRCTLKDFSIDFEQPHITQVQIKENNPEKGITFETAPWTDCHINSNGKFEARGEGWTGTPSFGMAFEEKTKRIIYQTSDIGFNLSDCHQIDAHTFIAPHWKDQRLIEGSIVAMRLGGRPTPGVFMSHDKDTRLIRINVHYAEGMGLLAQMSENITLDQFNICLKGDDDPRYFTTQADATHFSGCKGKITTRNSLYESMMDDAINVHGTYLKVVKRIDEKSVVGRYMHSQSWGFEWGRPGDQVQFITSKTMEIYDKSNKIKSITPHDQPEISGAKEYLITFEEAIDKAIGEEGSFGIENLEWTPEVLFTHNTIRNNRARGSLFSTPKKTIVEENLFDHTSGAAILLCGDCNGWFETGACREVIIRKNKFINALTSMFQFTNAVISIYPEIPDLKNQKAYFHGGNGKGVIIEKNLFETFDRPLVYAKSLDGLIIRKNKIVQNNEYPAYHYNQKRYWLQRVINYKIEKNEYSNGYLPEKDFLLEE